MPIGQKITVAGDVAGIDLAMARKAADCGAKVYFRSRSAERLKPALASPHGLRGNVIDVGDEESVGQSLSGLSEIDQFGQLNE